MESHVVESQSIQQELDFLIVSANLTIEAMRDSGYKNTDHALAELIDNSVEAKADLIEIIAVEKPPDPNVSYSRARISEIAVSDNGEGMDQTTLRRALKFGDGTRTDRRKRGIGRFGVGLPQSSISQCRRVDIWTWQNGPDNAIHCYLDLDDIKGNGRQDVPEPTSQIVPDRWRNVVQNSLSQTGTLVVWSTLDRVRWMGGVKTLTRTADLCGRIYRKFLATNQVQISLVLASGDQQLDCQSRFDCQPNDPLYLMAPSSTPKPFQDRPMFQLFNERKWTIPVDDTQGTVHVRCTLASPDAINESLSQVKWPQSYTSPGKSPWGKHADRNKGISIVRANRELELSLDWVNNYEPEERWWSVEVEFDPILDEIFGVVNNKQHAHIFTEGAGFEWEEMAASNETYSLLLERLELESDPRHHLFEIWTWIDDQIRRMRRERGKIRKGTGTSRHPTTEEEIEDVATKVINEQAEQGETGDSDLAPKTTDEEKIHQIAQSIAKFKVDEHTATETAHKTVSSGRRVLIKGVTLDHKDAFFTVESVSDVIEVWLNDRHPVHEHLIDVLRTENEVQEVGELAKRLNIAEFTLRMLLCAWARYEDKAPAGMKETISDVRMDWGREARKFLDVIEQ
ncbi:MAG: ATP-binding protein [Gemmatimonadetes bacterium]|nr:ATP-binding protein [Gemmatimonadota bacterium]